MRKKLSFLLIACTALSSLSLTACSNEPQKPVRSYADNVLRVASWDEYIDMGEDDAHPLYEDFEDWYFEQTGQEITVEYVALQDNETMYNKLKMGDYYDLLCPSEYMAMKLKSENWLQPFPDSFYDKSVETNYYAQFVSDFTENEFLAQAELTGYLAGYMWGTTGFVFNPEKIEREIMQSWNCVTSPACNRMITAKDNVRDSYFIGLGMYYENELLSLKARLENGEISKEYYKSELAKMMNDTSEKTMGGVKKKLEQMRKNLYGLETDEGKNEVIAGRLDASFQWSGDAVYILDEAESFGLELEYSIPEAASNIWFDGWVMLNGANTALATAFVNFLSRPDNVIRNMSYIGYTSCIAGEEVFAYVEETYSADEGDPDAAEYDLSYFFGEGYTLTANKSQWHRQLFAQYPEISTIDRLVVMKYFDKKTNERANRMWNNIK